MNNTSYHSDALALKGDVDAVALKLLLAQSPRAAASKLRRISKSLGDFAAIVRWLEADHRPQSADPRQLPLL